MSINPEFYPLPEPEAEAEIVYQDFPAFSSPLETEREVTFEPMQPEFIFEQQFEAPLETPSFDLTPETPEVKPSKPEVKTEYVEKFVEVSVETVRDLGFFAVLLAILFGVPLDQIDQEMI